MDAILDLTFHPVMVIKVHGNLSFEESRVAERLGECVSDFVVGTYVTLCY